tara:strand:- start:92 stop:439 length:348 start_codon:yes stop_codon:yes gene_type:complete
MKKLLIIALLLVGCDKSTKSEDVGDKCINTMTIVTVGEDRQLVYCGDYDQNTDTCWIGELTPGEEPIVPNYNSINWSMDENCTSNNSCEEIISGITCEEYCENSTIITQNCFQNP